VEFATILLRCRRDAKTKDRENHRFQNIAFCFKVKRLYKGEMATLTESMSPQAKSAAIRF
jgi:hypothetical protein